MLSNGGAADTFLHGDLGGKLFNVEGHGQYYGGHINNVRFGVLATQRYGAAPLTASLITKAGTVVKGHPLVVGLLMAPKRFGKRILNFKLL